MIPLLLAVAACRPSDTDVAPVERAARLVERHETSTEILTALEPDLTADDPDLRRHAMLTLGGLLERGDVEPAVARESALAWAIQDPSSARTLVISWCGTPNESCVRFASDVMGTGDTSVREAVWSHFHVTGRQPGLEPEFVMEILHEQWDLWGRAAFIVPHHSSHDLAGRMLWMWEEHVYDHPHLRDDLIAELVTLPQSPERDKAIRSVEIMALLPPTPPHDGRSSAP